MIGWVGRCLSADAWGILGVLFIWLGAVAAVLAVARLILGRIRVGRSAGLGDARLPEAPHVPAAAEAAQVHAVTLRRSRRRVVVEYAVTYELAVIMILIGVGLA